MPSQSFWINPHDPHLRDKVDALKPIPGYCIFIDIIASTAMKQKGIRHWISSIHNSFSNSELFLTPFCPLKSIGDTLMYYIEDSDLRKSGYCPLHIFDGLYQIATGDDHDIPPVKIGAARCLEAYALTFFPATRIITA